MAALACVIGCVGSMRRLRKAANTTWPVLISRICVSAAGMTAQGAWAWCVSDMASAPASRRRGNFFFTFRSSGRTCQIVSGLEDRKSVVEGKSVSVGVYLGGRGIIKNKTKKKKKK